MLSLPVGQPCCLSTLQPKTLASKRALYSRHPAREVPALGRVGESPHASIAHQPRACQTVCESAEQRRRSIQIHFQHVSTYVKNKNLKEKIHQRNEMLGGRLEKWLKISLGIAKEVVSFL